MLTILEEKTRSYHRSDRPKGAGRIRRFYLVQCSCGSKPFEISMASFDSNGQCRSCHNTVKNPNRSHGESSHIVRGERTAGTPEYRTWKSIQTRCYNKHYKQYRDYGGRGITVCQRWLESYSNFLSDMGRRPSFKHSIGRRNNDGPYSPENCFWATDQEQRLNKRTTVLVLLNGVTKPATTWCKELGVSKATFYWRRNQGWTDVECLLGKP